MSHPESFCATIFHPGVTLGILLRHHFPSGCHTRNPSTPPFSIRVSHLESFSAVISIRVSYTRNPSPPPLPPGCLTSRNPVPADVPPSLDVSHSESYPPSFPSPGVLHFKFSSLGFQVLKITFFNKALLPLPFLASNFHTSSVFFKRFEICKESGSVIPNNGVIRIDSGKIKWALVGALHM